MYTCTHGAVHVDGWALSGPRVAFRDLYATTMQGNFVVFMFSDSRADVLLCQIQKSNLFICYDGSIVCYSGSSQIRSKTTVFNSQMRAPAGIFVTASEKFFKCNNARTLIELKRLFRVQRMGNA